jgi:sodium transport system permease protein
MNHINTYKLWVVIKKEVVDAARDRRAFASAIAYALFGPFIAALLIVTLAKETETEPTIHLAVVGSENAPGLIMSLEQKGFTIKHDDTADAETVKQSDIDAVLIIPNEFENNWKALKPAKIALYVDGKDSNEAKELSTALTNFASYASQSRLIASGVAPAWTTPITVSLHDATGIGGLGSRLADMVVLFFILAPFFAGMGLAIDTTAGERERLSLTPLLAQPVSTRLLMAGKFIVVSLFTVIGALVTLFVGSIVLSYAPTESLETSLNFGPGSAIRLFLILGLLAVLAAGLLLFFALRSKSFKEAQTSLTLLSLAPALIGFGAIFSTLPEWSETLPILHQLNLMREVLLGSPLDVQSWLMSVFFAVSVTVPCLWASSKYLASEQIL